MKLFNFDKKVDGQVVFYFNNKKILSFRLPNKYTKIYSKRFKGLTEEETRYILEVQFEKGLGYKLNLDNPKSFNEKIQWMKLYDSTPIKTRLADKYLVRDWVKEKIGEEYLIPLLGVWDRFDEIDFDKLPDQFVLKCNHGSGYNIIVKDKSKLNIKEARKKINKWMKEDFAFKYGFEMHYSNIPRKIIAEKYINPDISNIEIQGWCFNNQLSFISYENCKDVDKPCRCIFNKNWETMDFAISPQNYKSFETIPSKPALLDKFISITEILCKNFLHVRIDFIVLENNLFFREMTFTSGLGLSKFEPVEWDYKLGEMLELPLKNQG